MIKKVLALFTLIVLTVVPVVASDEGEGPLERAGAVLDRGIERTKDFFSDTAITARVKQRFMEDDLIDSGKIKVKTTDGVVTMSGDADSKEIAKRALDIASATKGVKRVVSQLMIVSKTPYN